MCGKIEWLVVNFTWYPAPSSALGKPVTNLVLDSKIHQPGASINRPKGLLAPGSGYRSQSWRYTSIEGRPVTRPREVVHCPKQTTEAFRHIEPLFWVEISEQYEGCILRKLTQPRILCNDQRGQVAFAVHHSTRC